MPSIWTEKYRPKKFEDVIGQEDIIKRIKAFIEQKNMPHLLFSGPAGVGKTTTSLIIAKELFKENLNSNFLELNASDERGIDVIRNKVKDFARTKAIQSVPFKIIYLDECDSLTKDAQHALRRTMESYTNTCRCILSCNYISKIIDPIKSRCSIFKFKPLKNENIKKIIEMLSKEEKIEVDNDASSLLIEYSNGDIRKLENTLQACSAKDKKITQKIMAEIISLSEPRVIKEIIELTITKNFLEARNKLLEVMLESGLTGLDIIKQIQSQIFNLDIEDEKKLEMMEKCGEIEFRIVEGSDEFVQLESLLASFSKK